MKLVMIDGCVSADSECVYDEIKSKPGMRVGVIENLNQRLSGFNNLWIQVYVQAS